MLTTLQRLHRHQFVAAGAAGVAGEALPHGTVLLGAQLLCALVQAAHPIGVLAALCALRVCLPAQP
jgi:hypothetical protein